MKKKEIKKLMSELYIRPNTDGIDIDDNSLGLCCRFEKLQDDLHRARGLHIQIKHNQDKKQFEMACQIEKLISAAPEMLKDLEVTLKWIKTGKIGDVKFDNDYLVAYLSETIKKAKGDS